MRVLSRISPIVASIALAAAVSPATAGAVPAEVERALGGEVRELPSGHYLLEAPGPDVETHGPDMRSAVDDVADHGTGLGPGDPERPPACVDDPATGYYQEILYGYPAYAADDLAARRGEIQASVRRMNAVLNEESEASGGPSADYVVRCDGDQSIRVSSFAVPISSGSASFSQVRTAARAAGYTNPNADYTIFYDGSGPAGVCGTASLYFDESAGVDNLNNNNTTSAGYAVTYDGCWFGATPMHENGHNQGAVQYSAPYSTGDGAHCYDENDVMCYSPDGGDLNQSGTINRCADRLHFDCANDTYFDSAPEAGEWLATHWNLGSAANRFVVLGNEPGNDAPAASFASECKALSCAFIDTSSDPDGAIAARSWSFGDGAGGSGASVSHAFPAAGTYVTTLTVTDDDGDSSSTTRQLTVSPPPLGVSPAGENGGGAGPPPAPVVVALDTIIETGPRATVRSRRAFFELSSPAGVSFECRLDEGRFRPCRASFEIRVAAGKHRLVARARDSAGNPDPHPDRHLWRVTRR